MSPLTPPRCSSHRRRWIRSPIPVLLRPRCTSIRNRFTRWNSISASDIATLILTGFLMFGLYLCTVKTLHEWHRVSAGAQVSTLALSGVLGGLFMLVFCTASVGGIGSLFTARDLDFVLAAPLSTRSFLLGRVCEVALSTTWMLVVFCIPMYLAYGTSYGAGMPYYLGTPVILLCFLLVGVVGGVVLAVVLAALIPLNASRSLVLALFVLALATILGALQMTPPTLSLNAVQHNSATSLVGVIINHPYSLPRVVSLALTTLIEGSYEAALRAVGYILPLLLSLWFLLELTFGALHPRGYARLQSCSLRGRASRVGHSTRRRSIFVVFQRPVIAIASREFISFARDFTHTIQLGMLLGISILYLYNLRGIEPPTRVGTTTLQLWDICLLAASISLSGMIILSICTRFVFPSVSLEGQAFWILQASPLTLQEILTAKYRTWFLPIACMSAVVFTSGGLALGAEPLVLGALVVMGIIFAHGLVAVAINFGARFARFDWGHSAEIATTWGSLAYTATGCILIVISMIPVLLMFSVYILFPSAAQQPGLGLTIFGVGLFVLWLLHVLFGRIMAQGGAHALEQLRQ